MACRLSIGMQVLMVCDLCSKWKQPFFHGLDVAMTGEADRGGHPTGGVPPTRRQCETPRIDHKRAFILSVIPRCGSGEKLAARVSREYETLA